MVSYFVFAGIYSLYLAMNSSLISPLMHWCSRSWTKSSVSKIDEENLHETKYFFENGDENCKVKLKYFFPFIMV